MSNNLLIIFTKNPELGKVKTRLAKTIGDQAALDIYHELIKHTQKVCATIAFDKAVYYSSKIDNNDTWNNANYFKHVQKGSDLGEKMFNAFKDGFTKGYQNIIIIGTDLFTLTANDIAEAFTKLQTKNYVFGPAKDGGYYLIGMKKQNKSLFQNIAWSTSTVLSTSLARISENSYNLITLKNDIDTIDDLKDHPELYQQVSKLNNA